MKRGITIGLVAIAIAGAGVLASFGWQAEAVSSGVNGNRTENATGEQESSGLVKLEAETGGREQTGLKLAADDTSFKLIAESAGLQLSINGMGQVSIYDKRNGVQWRSNPDAEAMSKETAQGHWRGNLQSAFYAEYVDQSLAVLKQQVGNAQELEAQVSFRQLPEGVELTYDLRKINISFTYVISLKDDYLEVAVPADRIDEAGNYRLTSLWVLPFLGAAQTADADGYMFVPEGVGAVIPFNNERQLPFRYSTRIYGQDLAVGVTNEASTGALMPVFGMVAGQNAVLGIISEGAHSAKVNATPSGLYTTFNWVGPQFVYRQDYYKRTSRFGEGFQIFEKERSLGNSAVRYYFLSGDQADYVGMAAVYRNYLMETEGLKRIQGAEDELPVDLQLLGGDLEPGLFKRSFVTMTTFDQAREIVKKLKGSGIGRMNVSYSGWSQNGLHGSQPKRFPAEEGLGGNDGLKRLVDEVQRLGDRFFLTNDYTAAYSEKNGFNPRVDAVRDIDGRVVEQQLPLGNRFSLVNRSTMHVIRPRLAMDYMTEDLEKYKQLGIDGLAFDGLASHLFSDYSPSERNTRKDTAGIYKDMLKKAQDTLGQAVVSNGYAYALGHADHISSLPIDANYELLAEKTVPFYPIALHGLVSYSGNPGNLRNENRLEFLKSLEYGAVPSYLLTYEDSSLLDDTLSKGIYSSRFDGWIGTMTEEAQQMNEALGDVQDKWIVEHTEKAPGVFATTFEGGKTILVNYNSSPYLTGDVQVPPRDFIVLKGGRSG
ncbi:DUF5696 domain-containing protein [Paenibacillus contaminans]|uniref:Uncharacterized protein n=1 Tax=Paenibacillus contaminans TaxID=450362 RepID=A0A329MHM6_9BACL|nr:DUF5696 domain-containing protein [Paenibacillus contaminans]RAV19182.1 hypothetical protein DQG23_21835 [Paenibacillus contaminans]